MAEEKTVVQPRHRFIERAAALIDAVYGVDRDAVRRQGLDAEDFADRKEKILIGQVEMEADVRGRDAAFFDDIFQAVEDLDGVLRIVLDEKIERLHLIAESGHRHFGMGRRKNDKRPRVVLADHGSKLNAVDVRMKLDVEKIDGGFGFGGEGRKKPVRGGGFADDFHIVALDENIFFNQGRQQAELALVVFT